MAVSDYIIARLAVRGADEFLKALGQATKGFDQAGAAAQGFIKTMARQTAIAGFAIASINAVKVLRRLSGAFDQVKQEAFEGAIAFQELEIRLEGLLARQYKASGAAETVGQAYNQAGRNVGVYLDWIKQVAVTTPFEATDLANVFTLANAYGFTAKEAQTLTLAIGNFTAGMGLSGDVMRRIVENFGQMTAAGKVTGTELRDLARGAFIPVNDILNRMAENMGVAEGDMESFKEAAREGGVDVKEFFNAFVQTANEDFPDAMERMSGTWKGVTSNIRDFISTILGVEVLGPLVERFALIGKNALDNLLTPAVQNSASFLGESLGVAFDRIWESITGRFVPAIGAVTRALGIAAPTIEDIVAWIGLATEAITESIDAFSKWAETVGVDVATTLSDIASNAFVWGVNIATQLAEGLLDGASTAIVWAMNQIGNLFSYWLSPGSPPRVAPDIDLWGSQAFYEYLKGFTLVDFGILKSIQSPLKSALDIFVSLGKLSSGAAGNLFVSLSEGISQFLATGNAGTIFADLANSLGKFGSEIGELLNRQLALLQATEALEAAEKALDAARSNQDAAIDRVDQLKREYNELLRAGADPAVLQAKLAEINAAEDARAVAIEETKQAEAAVEAAEARIDPLKEAVQLQEELLRQLIQIQKAQQQGRGAGGGKPDFQVSGFSLGGLEEDGKKATKGIERNFNAIMDRLVAQLRAKLAGIWQESVVKPVQDAMNQVGASFSTAVVSIYNAWVGLRQSLLGWWDGTVLALQMKWQEFQNWLGQIASNVLGWIIPLIAPVLATIVFHLTLLAAQILVWWNDLTTALEPFKERLNEAVANIGEQIGRIIELVGGWFNENRETIMGVVQFIVGMIGFIFAWIVNIGGLIFQSLFFTISSIVGAIISFVFGFISTIVSAWSALITLWTNFLAVLLDENTTIWEKIWAFLVAWWGTLILTLSAWLTSFIGGIVAALSFIWERWSDFWSDLWTAITEWIPAMLQAGKDIIQGLWDGMVENMSAVIEWIKGIALEILAALGDVFDFGSPSKVMVQMGRWVFEGMEKGMEKSAPSLLKTAANISTSAAVVSAAPVYGGSGGSTVNMQFGDINTGMDQAMMATVIRRIIRQEMGG